MAVNTGYCAIIINAEALASQAHIIIPPKSIGTDGGKDKRQCHVVGGVLCNFTVFNLGITARLSMILTNQCVLTIHEVQDLRKLFKLKLYKTLIDMVLTLKLNNEVVYKSNCL